MGNRTENHPLGGGNKDAYKKNQIICEIANPAASQTVEVDMPKKGVLALWLVSGGNSYKWWL